jgi:hypothetical protein
MLSSIYPKISDIQYRVTLLQSKNGYVEALISSLPNSPHQACLNIQRIGGVPTFAVRGVVLFGGVSICGDPFPDLEHLTAEDRPEL